ncbi:MAG TPA: mannose-1-phosphate guanylyltransferase, partial [Paludibacteraceae bacterium]|nr:mannose-1-phosphate guanylyltransferase [Paludibacteraceae bacterium]
DRFCKIFPIENIYIASNEMYKDMIMRQLPQVSESKILLEPAMRNTAPCVAYAVNKIKAIDENANILVAPSDHIILKEVEFIDAINKGLDFVSKNDHLLTLGMKANRPETAYGYIQVSEKAEVPNFYKVKTFTEKPNIELAKIFIESGEFYWNSGLFMWNVRTISEAFEKYMPELASKFEEGKDVYNTPKEQEFIDRIYQSCTSLSIDYGILEKAQNVYVQVADFGWSDLGTWRAVYELSPKDRSNNLVVKGETLLYECKNNVIALPEGKLAVIQGVDNLIITEDENVLLICKREEEPRIRQFVNDTKVQMGEKYV